MTWPWLTAVQGQRRRITSLPRRRIAAGTRQHLILEPEMLEGNRCYLRIVIPLPVDVDIPFHHLASILKERNGGEPTPLSMFVFDIGEGYSDATRRFGGRKRSMHTFYRTMGRRRFQAYAIGYFIGASTHDLPPDEPSGINALARALNINL